MVVRVRSRGFEQATGKVLTEGAAIGDIAWPRIETVEVEWNSKRFLDWEVEEIGSARVQCSKMEKGLEQSKFGAGIFSKITRATSKGRAKIGLSEMGSSFGIS